MTRARDLADSADKDISGTFTVDDLTASGNVSVGGNLSVSGTTTTIDSANAQTVDLGDNDKIRLGDGDDLQIYHSGSHSYITDGGTGSLLIQGSDLVLEDPDGNNYLHAADGGAVQLYNNGSSKLATTSSGVDVTGDVIVKSGNELQLNRADNARNMKLFTDNNAGTIRTTNDPIIIDAASGRIRFDIASSEKARLDSSGNLLVGKQTNSVTVAGSAFGGNGVSNHAADSAAALNVGRLSNSGDLVNFYSDSTPVGSIGTQSGTLQIDGASGSTGLLFGASNIYPRDNGANSDGGVDLGGSTIRFKDLYISGGIYFPSAGGSGTSSSTYLDSYEEGTWTPTTSGVSSWSFTSIRSATYTKIGRMVHITLNASMDGSSVSNQIEIGGLPFTPASGNTGRANATPWMDYLDTGTVGTIQAGIWNANPKIRHYITRTDSNVNQADVSSNHLNSSGLTEYQLNIQYLTS